MDENDRNTIVGFERAKALKFLSQACDLCDMKLWDLAANRFYYACFHVVQALFVKEGLFAHTHSGMITLFNLKYIKTKRLDVTLGSFLSRMMQIRQKADYNCIYEITERDVMDIKPLALSFISSIEKLLDEEE